MGSESVVALYRCDRGLLLRNTRTVRIAWAGADRAGACTSRPRSLSMASSSAVGLVRQYVNFFSDALAKSAKGRGHRSRGAGGGGAASPAASLDDGLRHTSAGEAGASRNLDSARASPASLDMHSLGMQQALESPHGEAAPSSRPWASPSPPKVTTLDVEQFQHALPASVREQHTQIEVSAWFRLADKGGDGKSISILEWVQLAISMAALVTGAGMHDIFSSYDRDGSGFLGQTEFENAAEDLGFGECAPRHRRPLDCT